MLKDENILKQILAISKQLISHFENLPVVDLEQLKKEWITGNDVEQILKVKSRTLLTWRENGVLPYTQIRGKILYKISDVEKLLNDNYSAK